MVVTVVVAVVAAKPDPSIRPLPFPCLVVEPLAVVPVARNVPSCRSRTEVAAEVRVAVAVPLRCPLLPPLPRPAAKTSPAANAAKSPTTAAVVIIRD